jgi:hypothetical protein
MKVKEHFVDSKVKLKWPVKAKVDDRIIEGVTKEVSAHGAYVCCAHPLRLNEVFDMVIETPTSQVKAKAEVIWSNIYGPDDTINPRGMGVRFLKISSVDRKVLAKEIWQHLNPDEEIDDKQLALFNTLTIDKNQIGPTQQ